MNGFGVIYIETMPNKTINLDKLKQLVTENKSTHQIAKELEMSPTNVRRWLKILGLKTHSEWKMHRMNHAEEIKTGFKTCSNCKIKKKLSEFYIYKSGRPHSWCYQCSDESSTRLIRERKERCIEYKGGKCIVCGYNKYIGSMTFHHLDPSVKNYNIAKLKSYTLEELKPELDKCVLLCLNCHGETHSGLIDISEFMKLPTPYSSGPSLSGNHVREWPHA